MASLYEQLMASKGAPKAAGATNSTQLRKAPVSLRSAMRKYAAGGDVGDQGFDDGQDMSRSVMQEAPLQGGNLGAGLAQGIQGGLLGGNLMQALMAAAQQAQAQNQQTMTPSMETTRPSTNDFAKFKQDIQEPRFPERTRPPEPRYEEPPRPIAPDRETPYRPPETRYLTPPMPQRGGGTSQQPQGPQTSYRMNDDGSLVEIGYDGQPISGYTPEQLDMQNATRGITPSQSRYVYNGEGYDLVYDQPRVDGLPEPSYEEIMPVLPPVYDDLTPVSPPEVYPQYPTDPGFYQPPMGYIPLPGPYPEYPSDYEEIMPVLPPVYDDLTPVPPPEVYPQYPTDPGFYQPPVDYTPTRPVDYYNPSPPMDFTQDPGILQPTEPVYNPFSKRGGDLAKLLADLIARKGGGGSLEKQRGLMELLDSIKGK